MDKPIETIEYKGFKIDIFHDDNPMNPREWDNLGTMLCKHERYDLGDKESKAMSAEDIRVYVARKDVISLALYLYNHSGLYIWCSSDGSNPFTGRLPQGHAEFDSGLVGWITLIHEKARKEYSVKRITKTFRTRMEKYLVNEVETYVQYLRGDVYRYSINGVDSCCEFYGTYWKQNGLLESAENAIDYHITNEKEKQDHAALLEPVTNA